MRGCTGTAGPREHPQWTEAAVSIQHLLYERIKRFQLAVRENGHQLEGDRSRSVAGGSLQLPRSCEGHPLIDLLSLIVGQIVDCPVDFFPD